MKNEFYNLALKRRSVRKFKSDLIKDEDISYLLEVAMSAPSACNKQPWEFFVIKDSATLERLRTASKYSKIVAPLAIVVCGNLNRNLSKKDNDFWIQDASSAITHILLGVTALDLGAVWCGGYPLKSVVNNIKEILNLGDELIPLGTILIGHPDEEKEPRTQYNQNYVHII